MRRFFSASPSASSTVERSSRSLKSRVFQKAATAVSVSLAASALMLAAPVLAEDPVAQQMTVEQLIAKNNEARGGQAAWAAVDAVKINGKMAMGEMQAPFTIYFKRPNRMRMEMEVQGTQMVQGYDGTQAWAAVPLMGQMEARALGETETSMLRRQADFEGPLFAPEEKGHTIELMGLEEVDGKPAYKLKMELAEGDTSMLYLDAETFLEMRMEGEVEAQGQTLETEVLFSDWREVDGLTLQHSVEMRSKGAPSGQKVLFDTVEILPASEVADDLFTMPESAGS